MALKIPMTRSRELILVGLVIITAVLANMPEETLQDWQIERNYLLALLAMVVFIALFLYLKFQFFFMVVLLALGANMPIHVAESLGMKTTRIITDHMQKTLGQTIVIQNEPGAGGTLAMSQTIKAQPDGYTLLTVGPTVSTIKELFPNATVDPARDLQPVTIVGQTPMVLVTHKDVPGSDYGSLLAYIKSHPGELTFASNGRGSAGHLAGSLFKKMANADLRYIPYRSTPQATTDLLAAFQPRGPRSSRCASVRRNPMRKGAASERSGLTFPSRASQKANSIRRTTATRSSWVSRRRRSMRAVWSSTRPIFTSCVPPTCPRAQGVSSMKRRTVATRS